MRTTASNTLSGHFYDGRTPLGTPATLIWSGNTVKVIGAAVAQDYQTAQLRVSPRVGRAARFVSLPDGGQLQCFDHPLLDRLPQEGKAEGMVAWLEQRWQVALAAIAITVTTLALGYFYGLPAIAERVAANVPIEYEQKLGEKILGWLDGNAVFRPSELDAETQELLTAGFRQLADGSPMELHMRLEFRNTPGLGANALAFPGGTIVVTDQLIDLAQSAEEVYAVMAHEIGHVEQRHALRHILHDSVTATVAATLTADTSSLTLAVSGLPVVMAKMKYSREFETEADDFAFKLLQKHNLSPEHFATIMERMSEARGERRDRQMSFLSTHPVTVERIARARQAAERTWIEADDPAPSDESPSADIAEQDAASASPTDQSTASE